MDRKFVMAGLGYALVGLALGIYMAASKNHSQLVTHAHIMLLGFVVSFIYGVCHKLWLQNVPARMANLQFYIHQLGTLVLLIGLFCLFAGLVPEPILGPVLGIASVIVFSGLVLMKVMFIKYART
ncbi:TonB-dependent receptor [Pokkaliibacter plantistimulans]|uniref:TonB-dependent receptor n=1 Tax=Pokkaliibacter plantistimulans TaxID=1635171 RepID=A0ABX5LVJ1_9GAMM|nr:TonB-dependent receptor [Pokkaliibacter plantistimulans]PXF29478.1 TonB-dependent receptor [Pokkaliibacter plantistimulans]